MKTLNFNKKSWHYWVATKMGDFDFTAGDFCAYLRSVFLGLFFLLVIAAFVALLMYFIGLELRAAYTCTFSKVCTFGKTEEAFADFVAGLTAFAGFLALCSRNEKRKARIRAELNSGVRKPQQPGFLAMAYKSLKEKTCFKVEFK